MVYGMALHGVPLQRYAGTHARPGRNQMTKIVFLLLLPVWVAAQPPKPPAWLPDPADVLQAYRQRLVLLRQQYPSQDSLPDSRFFLFGMGNRLKLIYRAGRLINAHTGHIERQWNIEEEIIVPSEYTVQLNLRVDTDAPARLVQIREDETGVWVLETGQRALLIRGTRTHLNLPRFTENPNGAVLRVLLQEVLMNIMDGQPLSNFLVYDQPIVADATLMKTVLTRTNNTDQLRNSTPPLPDADAPAGTVSNLSYPISWERNAPNAHYPGLTVLDKTLVKQKLIMPQAGHAASLFLHLSGQ